MAQELAEQARASRERTEGYRHMEENRETKSKIREQWRQLEEYAGECCACPTEDGKGLCAVPRQAERCCEAGSGSVECGRPGMVTGCLNQRIFLRQTKQVEIKPASAGLGCFLLEQAGAEDLLLEYVGVFKADLEGQHRYTMRITGGHLVAAEWGNDARFVNHSCRANAVAVEWRVQGRYRIGIFAKWALAPGEEVTIDYNWMRLEGEWERRTCGESAVCKGFLGGRKGAGSSGKPSAASIPGVPPGGLGATRGAPPEVAAADAGMLGSTIAPAAKAGAAKGAPPKVLRETRTKRSKRLHCEEQAACISPVCSTPEQERRREQEGDSGRALRRRLGEPDSELGAAQEMTPEQEAQFAQSLAEEDRAAAEQLEAEVVEKALGQKDGNKRRRRDPG